MENLFFFEDSTLEGIKKSLIADGKWGINIGFHELSLLRFLIQTHGIKNILEIGTLYGFSTYGMARFLPEDGKITTIELSSEIHKKAVSLSEGRPFSSKIEYVCADAQEYLANSTESYDLIFIDANKSAYLKYLDLSEKLIKPGGLIIGDNTFLFGHVYGEGRNKMPDKTIEALKEFNQRYVESADYLVTMIPTSEGMTIIKKQ